MKTYQWIGIFVILGIILVSCGGGGNSSSPTSPSITSISSNISGNWLFSGSLTDNTCVYTQNDPLFQIGLPGTDTLQIIQNNTALTASHIDGNLFTLTTQFTGTITGNTLNLSVSNPLSGTNGTCVYSVGGGGENILIDESSGNGTVSIAVASVTGNCTILGTLPCSIVYTGTWRKISSGTNQPTPTPVPTTTRPTPIPTTAPQPTPVPTSAPIPTPVPTGSSANCQGCCSSHGGVVCIGGITMCGDGSPLSDTCRNKGCNMCL